MPHHLRVLSAVCDRVFLLCDLCPEGAAIASAFPKVQTRSWDRTPVPQDRADGACWNEGAMRQAVWDWATECRPDLVLLSDADESPAPALAAWLSDNPDPAVECFYADWVNLVHDAGHAIGGPTSVWSFQNPATNKKGMLVRYRAGRQYRYRMDCTRHARMEPSPVNEYSTRYDATHRLGPVPLIHHRWAAWERWRASERAARPYWNPWPPADATIVDVPRSMLWRWDAEDLIEGLTEPIAVVGNGMMRGCKKEIDAHATIVRLNNWRTVGHEENVGNRTDVWCTSCWDDVEMRDWTGPMFTPYHDDCQFDRLSRWLGTYPHMATPRRPWYQDALKLKTSLGRFNPSTGLILLTELAEMGKSVSAFGFDGLRSGHYWDAAHGHNHDDELPALMALSDRIRFR